jgi:hypothetical protein
VVHPDFLNQGLTLFYFGRFQSFLVVSEASC